MIVDDAVDVDDVDVDVDDADGVPRIFFTANPSEMNYEFMKINLRQKICRRE